MVGRHSGGRAGSMLPRWLVGPSGWSTTAVSRTTVSITWSSTFGTFKDSDMTDPPTQELTITRIFDAPRELVFRAWIDPDPTLYPPPLRHRQGIPSRSGRGIQHRPSAAPPSTASSTATHPDQR